MEAILDVESKKGGINMAMFSDLTHNSIPMTQVTLTGPAGLGQGDVSMLSHRSDCAADSHNN